MDLRAAPDGFSIDAMDRHDRHAGLLLVLYLTIWSLLAIAPRYRADWLLENVLVFLALPALFAVHRHLSKHALTALFVFLCLHAVGAHYTYAEVPYDAWSEALFGYSLGDLLGWQRNHYDRLVHFLYGLLVSPAFVELIDRRCRLEGAWHWLLPFGFMAAHAAIYELIEWWAALWFGGELGMAYLGTQGDIWDAHKDTALALFGSALAVSALRLSGRRSGRA